jgi:thiol-disulfide isomerase/thioredoxin
MQPLGTKAPEFLLADSTGRWVSSTDFQAAPALLVTFICNHCPYVKHIQSSFTEFAKKYQQRGVAIVAINSNDVENYPDDRPEMTGKVRAQVTHFPTSMIDPGRLAHRRLHAGFLPIDRDRRLVYRGQYDDSCPKNDRPACGADLSAALDAPLAGRPVRGAKTELAATSSGKPPKASQIAAHGGLFHFPASNIK